MSCEWGTCIQGHAYCFECMQYRGHVQSQVWSNVRRARKISEPATLTVEQWGITLDYFYHLCAYCGKENACGWYMYLDHYVPLGMGKGTTWENCVPVCAWCNAKKRNIHPSQVKLIASGDMKRVHTYLQFLEISSIFIQNPLTNV